MNRLEVAIPGLIIASPAFGESTISFHIEIELLVLNIHYCVEIRKRKTTESIYY